MQFLDITKYFDSRCVFERFNLKIEGKTIMSVVGPSGEGKTTLLRLAAGLLQPDSGKVIRDVGEEGSISYLFQEPRLLPYSTVFTNVELVLRRAYPNQKERQELVLHYLGMVGLSDSLGLYPAQLSGGMRQRVSIARAFAYPSSVMLLDEPFQSLDIKLKYSLLNAFIKLWEESPKTTLFVTHDPKEAILIGDAVCCLGDPKRPKLLTNIDIPRSARNIDDQRLLALEATLVRSLVEA